jgi:predicted regulator of Ras-like GTPase activity (Roadblock/LC7/MglB family)
MLRTILTEWAREIPGCQSAGLVGIDGMVVEQWTGEGGPPLEVLGGELTPLMRAVSSLSRNTDGGDLREIMVRLQSWSCLIQPVTEEIYLIIVAGREAVPGRMRFEALRATAKFEAALR